MTDIPGEPSDPAFGASLVYLRCVVSPPQATVGKPAGVTSPKSRPFAERALEAMNEHGPLVFGLDPFGDLLADWRLGDTPDGLDRFVDIVVEACVGTVGVVKPQSAFYERHGWRGARSLARLVESCRESGVLVLLDAKRGDVGSTNRAYAEAYLGAAAPIEVDAITITPYLGFESMRPVLDLAVASNASVFVVTRSTNPEGRAIQGSVHPNGNTTEQQIITDIAAENQRVAPGAIGPIGSVFGPTHGPPAFDLRIMNGLFLAPGVGAQGATPREVASCFASCPERVLPSASRSLLQNGPDPSRLRAGALELGSELRDALYL
jgi:orotidine-5'-phosphate decarboxylase